MNGIFDDLHLITLDKSQHDKTCGYWYLVQNHCAAHTAFASREHLLNWLSERGLELTDELPKHGEWSVQKIKGKYIAQMHGDYNEVMSRTGYETRTLSNGEYTLAIIDEHEGIKTVHTLNPNCKRRPVFNYAESRALFG